MTSLRKVWAEAWAELPDVVHEAFSQGRFPKKAVMTGMFPTAFASLEPSLRTYNWIKRNPVIGAEDEALIREAVRSSQEQLAVAAANYQQVENARNGDDLGMSRALETLSAFAWRNAQLYGLLGEAQAQQLLWQAYPPAATWKNVNRALDDPGFAAEVEQLLADAEPLVPPTHGDADEVLAELLAAVTSSRALAEASSSTEPILLDDGEQEAWDALVRHPGLLGVHRSVVGLQLAHQLPVPVPGLHESAPRPVERQWRKGVSPMMPDPLPLEQSLLERLRRALSAERVELEGVDAAGVARDEVKRIVSPVGLGSPGAHAVFAIMAALAVEIGVARTSAARPTGLAAAPLPTTVLGESFTNVFHRVDAAKNSTRGFARVSQGALAYLADPVAGYVQELWGRAHGYDVRGTIDFSDLEQTFRQLVLGVRETLFRRLDKEHGGDMVWPKDDLPDRAVDSLVEEKTLDRVMSTRADALPEILAVLGEIARVAPYERAALGTFLAVGDVDPEGEKVWDRLREVARAPDWLTYDVTCAVLPLLRTERDEE